MKQPTQTPSATYRYLWRLARYRPGLYLLSGTLASTLFYLFPLVPGLIVQRFFPAWRPARQPTCYGACWRG